MIRFLLDGEIQTLSDVDPTQTVLEWLRRDARRMGTKEGCAEGDCGACTVVLGELVEGVVRYRAVNACIVFLPMLNGKELVTVESIGNSKTLHPSQKMLADSDGSQCGFCTPGFVMSLFARYQASDPALSENIDDVLAGNLCRCTGYGPIRRVGEEMVVDKDVQCRFGGTDTVTALQSLVSEETVSLSFTDPVRGVARKGHVPQCEEDLQRLLAEHPNAVMVSGATDVGLWVTKQHRDLNVVIFLSEISTLKEIRQGENGVTFGAGVKYSDALASLEALHPDLKELVRRVGSTQVRNSGTIGGNIANGSPIADTPPALIALGARLILKGAEGVREIPLEDYFIEYGKQDLRPGEFVSAVTVKKPEADVHFRTYKISKRFDQDISAACGAFSFRIDKGLVKEARIAFGGMAGTPKRAAACEAVFTNAPWTLETVEDAANAMATDYAPLSDMRASSEYRMTVAQNLLRKAYLEYEGGERTRILEIAHG